MALLSLLVVSLAILGTNGRAGLPVVDDGTGMLATLPVTHVTRDVGDESPRLGGRELPAEVDFTGSLATLPIPQVRRRKVVPRDLPVDREFTGSMMTLPVTHGTKRDGNADSGLDARGLPVVDDVSSGMMVTLPVPKAGGKGSRSVERALPLDAEPGNYITLPVIHSTNERYFEKRAVQATLANRSDVAYYAQLNIGTPPQSVYVQLDTGSFELWVNPDCSDLTGSDVRFCQAVGRYDSSKSSSAKQMPGATKTLKYGIGSADIQYVIDDMSIGEAQPATSVTQVLKQIQFGVATDTTDEFAGILGIGFGLNITTKYPNFVDELAAQGITQTKAFSIALGSKFEQQGVIAFGALDTGKFAGSLAKLPIIPAAQSPDKVPRYWVAMKQMTLTPPSKRTRPYANSTIPVFLDSGATLTLLPSPLASAVAADFGATTLDSNGFYSVDCGIADLAGTLDFVFDGVTINVPYKELIRNIQTSPPTCYLGIVPNGDFVLLGDTFMRSAYAVFDLDHNMVYLQQYVNCGNRLATITPNTNFGTVVGSCSPSQAQVSSPAPAESSTPSTPSTGSSSSPVSPNSPSSSSGTGSSASGTVAGGGASPGASGGDPFDTGFPPGSAGGGLGSGAHTLTSGKLLALSVALGAVFAIGGL